ncbi:MAG: hypothetical protein AAGG06_18625 [Pseudomonadota bacterium]
MTSVSLARAEPLTAGVILDKMDAEERFTYLAGLMEGLAYARYLADGKASEGQNCLYAWFYETRSNRRKIEEVFRRYPDHRAAPIVLALTKRDCGAP